MSFNPPPPPRAARFPSPTTISVASLLNPLPHGVAPQSPSGRETISTPTLTYASYTPSVTSAPSTPPQQAASLETERPPTTAPKLAKDAPLFTSTPSPTKGPVVYPPFEQFAPSTDTDQLLNELSQFEVYPLGNIATHGVRHIPYASAKKGFYERTGRDSFEVFQYTFKPPASLVADASLVDKTFTVMWDYNIGLVRITPFFKCCGFSKTTPSKMLAQNPHLRDHTYSITGGSLAAQGYWLPFTAAKHICATFCWHIRWALVPLFGPEFPATCLSPSSDDWTRMTCPISAVENIDYGTYESGSSKSPRAEDGKVSGWTPISQAAVPRLAPESTKRPQRQINKRQTTNYSASIRQKSVPRRATINKKRKRYPISESSVSPSPSPSPSPTPSLSPSPSLSPEPTGSHSPFSSSPASSSARTKTSKHQTKKARTSRSITQPAAAATGTISDEDLEGLDPNWLDHLHTLATLHRQPRPKNRNEQLAGSDSPFSSSSISPTSSADDAISYLEDEGNEEEHMHEVEEATPYNSTSSPSKTLSQASNTLQAALRQPNGAAEGFEDVKEGGEAEEEYGEEESQAAFLLLELAKADAELAMVRLAETQARVSAE